MDVFHLRNYMGKNWWTGESVRGHGDARNERKRAAERSGEYVDRLACDEGADCG